MRIGAQNGCSVCDSGKGCGAGLFGRLLKHKPLDLELPNTVNVTAGEAVILGIPENLYARLVFRVYGLPLIIGLLGAAIAHYWAVAWGLSGGKIDIVALGGGLIGGAAALIFWTRASKPDISTADIRLMTSKSEFSACDVSVPGFQINKKEV